MKKYTLSYTSNGYKTEVHLDISRDAIERAKKLVKDGTAQAVRYLVFGRCTRVIKAKQPAVRIPTL